MSDSEKKQQTFYVWSRDSEVTEVPSGKLRATVMELAPCIVSTDREDFKRVLRLNDRTSFEVLSK